MVYRRDSSELSCFYHFDGNCIAWWLYCTLPVMHSTQITQEISASFLFHRKEVPPLVCVNRWRTDKGHHRLLSVIHYASFWLEVIDNKGERLNHPTFKPNTLWRLRERFMGLPDGAEPFWCGTFRVSFCPILFSLNRDGMSHRLRRQKGNLLLCAENISQQLLSISIFTSSSLSLAPACLS